MIRWNVLGDAIANPRLTQGCKLWFVAFLGTYEPGELNYVTIEEVCDSIGMNKGNGYKWTRQLKAEGYLARGGPGSSSRRGWICPKIESQLDPYDRVDNQENREVDEQVAREKTESAVLARYWERRDRMKVHKGGIP